MLRFHRPDDAATVDGEDGGDDDQVTTPVGDDGDDGDYGDVGDDGDDGAGVWEVVQVSLRIRLKMIMLMMECW